jgi:hypothetical protein
MEANWSQIKLYLSRAPNTTGRPYSEMLSGTPLTLILLKTALLVKKVFTQINKNKILKSNSKITIARLNTGGTGRESMCEVISFNLGNMYTTVQ